MSRFDLSSLVGRAGQSNTAQVITAGTPVGYDRSFVATEDTVIATVGIGFADGYPRHLSNLDPPTPIGVNGHMCHLAGKVCMDMLMVACGPPDSPQGQVSFFFLTFSSNIEKQKAFSIIFVSKNALFVAKKMHIRSDKCIFEETNGFFVANNAFS